MSVSTDELGPSAEAPEPNTALGGDPEVRQGDDAAQEAVEDLDPAPIDEQPTEAEQEASYERLVARGRRLSSQELAAVVESLLFVADRPLRLAELVDAAAVESARVEEVLSRLMARSIGQSGLLLQEVGGGYQLRTSPIAADHVRRYLKVKPQRLTKAALETLAIIAYRQPVTRPEVEEIRGVDCGAVMKALLDRRLIKILGKKDEVGRPILYGTTQEFLEFFALRDLAALPTLREFQELTQEHQEIVEKSAPPVAGMVEALEDKDFQSRLSAAGAASEEALEQLEEAMAAADETSKTATGLFEQQAGPSDDPPVAQDSLGRAP